MGFYSFYKIIKDVIRTLFGKKFLKIIILIFLILFFILIFNNKTQAYSTSDTLNFTFHNNSYTLPSWIENYNYSCIINTTPNFSDRCDFLFIVYDNNVNEYLTEYVYDNAITFIRTSGSVGFHVAKVTSVSDNDLQTTINERVTTDLLNTSTQTSTYIPPNAFSLPDKDLFIKGTVNIVNKDTNEPIYSSFVNPSLSNTQSELENLSFNNFIINANSFTETMINNPDEPLVMLFYNRSLSNSNNTAGLYPIKEKYFYKESIYFDGTNSTDDNYIFNFPIFKSGVFFNIGSTYEIRLAKRVYIPEYDTWGYDYFDNSYIFTISSSVTQDYINQLNQQTATSTDEDNQENIENAINNQTQSIDNINNTINDSNVDSSSIDLPTDNTNDITQGGVDNIFQTIYNSFTSGTAQDIVFPIPFTNKSITLHPNYLYNMLQSNNANWLITIIQAFWWYLISRFIITDIMKKIRKIKQGNFENIQNSNIKEDML